MTVRTGQRPQTMDDISLNAGERGIMLGMTRTGKSTLAEQLIEQWRNNYQNSRTIILDSKPRFRAEKELDGRSTRISRRYAKWDWGVKVPGSVVIPLNNPRAEIKHAWSLGTDCIICQIEHRQNINKLDLAIQYAYMDRAKGRPLFFYVDELNNFFRPVVGGKRANDGIIMVLTSGGERSVAFLGAAQRPRHISVEAMESMTKLYWFYTSFKEDKSHLMNMGIPQNAQSPQHFYQFYFFDRMTMRAGTCQLVLNQRQRQNNSDNQRRALEYGRRS